MCRFKDNPMRSRRTAFTMVEVAAALVLLSIILSSVMVLMNRYVASVMDLQLQQEAFELARGNMELLLTESKLSDIAEIGNSERNPEIEWQTLVEPFYEPITNQMWIRAICSAAYTDGKGESRNIELEHWITNLTAAQVKQIVAQQQVEAEYMDLLAGGEESEIQETTAAYLKQEGLDYRAYERFAERQKRKKLEYINEKGSEGYEAYVETLKEEENEFLEELGMDFDGYNEFAAGYVPRSTLTDSFGSGNAGGRFDPGSTDSGTPNDTGDSTGDSTSDPGIDWSRIPREFWPLFKQLGFDPPE